MRRRKAKTDEKPIVVDISNDMADSPKKEIEAADCLIDRLKDELEALSVKLTVDMKKFIDRLDFSKEVLMKFTPKLRKQDVYTSVIVLAFHHMQPKELSVRLDIRSDLARLNLAESVEERAQSFTNLESVQISEDVQKMEEGKIYQTKFALEFFNTVVSPSKQKLRKLQISSNNDETVHGILERLKGYTLESLSIAICKDDFGRFNSAMHELNLTSLRQLNIGSNIPAFQTSEFIDVFFKTIELMTNLQRLRVYYRCTGREPQIVDSVVKLANLEQLVFENDFHLTKEQALRIYNENIFLCSLIIKNRAFFNTLDAEVRGIVYLYTARKYNYNRICKLINEFDNSDIKDLRSENLMNISDYLKIVVM